MKIIIVFFALLVMYSNHSLAQVELEIYNDSLSIEDKSIGLGHTGLGLNGLLTSSALSESLLNPFEMRIIQTPLLPFFGSSRMSYNSLKFEFSDIGIFDLDWDLTRTNDALGFNIGYEFTRQPGGLSIHYAPFLMVADTSTLYNYFYLRDRIGLNVDTVKESRLTIFSEDDLYNSDNVGAIQVYKDASLVGAAVAGIGSSKGDDSGVVMTSGTLAGFALVHNLGVYGHAVDTAAIGVIGANGGNHYTPDRWGALGTSEYAVYANGVQFSTSATTWSTSDAQLKQQVKANSQILEKVLKLAPKEYKYKTDASLKNLSFPVELQHGFLAQDVEKVFPELVRDVELLGLPEESDNRIYKAINYNGFIAILTAAIQESHKKLLEQENRINDLQDKLTVTSHDSDEKIEYRLQRFSPDEAKALTPFDGTMIYITSAGGQFTSPGFWGYENGVWKKLTR